MLGERFLALHGNGHKAFMLLQVCLMRHFVARGGDKLDWCERLAPAYRRRYGWLLEH